MAVTQVARAGARRITIHLIEDDADHAYLLKRSFERQAYSMGFACFVAHVADGQKALEELKSLADAGALPDMLVVDLSAHGAERLSFIKTVKEDPDLKSICVVVMTAADDVQTYRQDRDDWVKAAYPKPYASVARDALCVDVLEQFSEALSDEHPGAA
eukprot:g17312.t1